MTKENTDDRPPGFSAYILLSEPLQFSTTEIEEALLEDYPGLDIKAESDPVFPQNCDTDEFITAPILFGYHGADCGVVSLIRMPGYGTWDPAQLAPSQRLQFLDVGDVMASNASYICVTVGAIARGGTAQFRAARLCSCLAAIFAKLPIALAVYWESADHFLRPDDVVAMADKAMQDEYPIEQWIGMRLVRPQDPPASLIMGSTVGLQNFKGAEVTFAHAPVDLNTVATTILTTTAMLTSLGHNFTDGDTVGSAGQDADEAIRIRRVAKGQLGAGCDQWLLIHPDSSVDHVKLLGKLKGKPAPKDQRVEVESRSGFFKWIMRKGRTT